MRLVISIPQLAADDCCYAQRLARSVLSLHSDGHSVVILVGQECSPGTSICECGWKTNGSTACSSGATLHASSGIMALAVTARRLVTFMARVGLPGIVFCASDAGLTRVRKRYVGTSREFPTLEVVNASSRWLDIVSSNKGVPIVSNLYFCECEKVLLVEPNMIAAYCAQDWKASLLIYLTEENGIRAANGDTIRWLDVRSSELLVRNGCLSPTNQDRLRASAVAIQGGVGRVRLLPLSEINTLASFYFQAVTHGTEIVANR